ncbi:MAG: TatD family hydrolase [Clostridia bacterium]|nr:TatD family hydrolase [Clostridia bacterium]
MLFDTHAHLDDARFDEDRESVIAGLKDAGVSLVVNIGADMESSAASVALSKKYDFIYAAVGVHPDETGALTEADMETLAAYTKEDKVVAIGEIGLDYHNMGAEKEVQKTWFRRQLLLAKELSLPYIVHDRDAHADVLEIIKESGYYNGVMHCYSGSAEMVREVVGLGMMISFAGPVTFKNAAKTKDAALAVPLDHLMVETDCPYLSPEPHRGKRNDSSRVRFVAEEIARIKGISLEELAKITKENGKRFFRISE